MERASLPALPPMDASNLADSFRQAMRRMAASVCILTSRDPHGTAVGMSATAVTSLTVDPPALLICVNRTASMHASLTVGRPVAIHILGEQQDDLCFTFGGRAPPAERFANGTWSTDAADVPMLDDAQANLSCTVDALHHYGTHSIVIARVDDVRIGGPIRPLVYVDGRLSALSDSLSA